MEWSNSSVNPLPMYSVCLLLLKKYVLHLSLMCFLQSLILCFNLGIYFSVCLALMVISLLETVIITNVLHHNSIKYQEVPNWVRVVVLKHIANLICYQWPEEIKTPAEPQKDEPEISNGDSGLWIIQPASQTPDQDPPIIGGNPTQ